MQKRFLLLVLSLLSMITTSYANNEKDENTESIVSKVRNSNFHLGLEFQTKYLWRGQEYGTSPALFPSVSYAYKGFSIGAIGAYAWDGSHQECDLFASYSLSGLTISVTDYYYPSSVGESDNYFDFKNKSTGHWWEAALSYEHEKVPVWFLVSTYFAGADKNTNGKQAWSSYVEIGTHVDFLSDNSVSLTVGGALNRSFYNNFETGFSIVNVALKYSYVIKLKNDYEVPVSVSYVVNPQKEKSYINFAASFGI